MVTWRGRGLISRCLDALAAQTRTHRVLVIDNDSADGTTEELAAHPLRPRVLRLPHNRGYAGALAAALPHIKTPFMAWLNDDAEPSPDWLDALERSLDADASTAAAASVLLDSTGAVRSTGVALTAIGSGCDITDTTGAAPFGFCGGAALLRTDVLREAGGVPGALFCYYEDTDTSWRLRLRGYRIRTVPDARVRHAGGASARHGTPAFHRWNERNRLLVLLRCAPVRVAARELARFAGLTVLLPWRPDRPGTPNFVLFLRLRVLAEVAARLPATMVARRQIGRRAVIARSVIWSTWAGRAGVGSDGTAGNGSYRDGAG